MNVITRKMFKVTSLIRNPINNNLQGIALRLAATTSEAKNPIASEVEVTTKTIREKVKPEFKHNSMVAAAFASLKQNNVSDEGIKTPHTDERLDKAQTVNQLLSVSDGKGVSRRHALKVVSILSQWHSTGKVALSDFETDPRFLKVCKTLSSERYSSTIKTTFTSKSEDLSTVLNVTADDEAAKLVATITLPQMVKVMTTLGHKKRRSTLLLRSLAFNICGSSQKLDVKQCGDVLYSMATLNFYDSNLMEKICGDVCAELKSDIKRSAVVGSILTSLGILRYKDLSVLDALGEWVVKNSKTCRPQDMFALFQTYGVLNHQSPISEELNALIPQLVYSEAGNPQAWLEFVWSLVLLNMATPEHVASVLSEEFANRFEDLSNVSAKLKLLNVDGYASTLTKYEGPRVSSKICETDLLRSKEKEEMVEAIVSALKNLMPAKTYLRTNVNTGMGFYIDAVCVLDKKCNPIPLDKSPSTENKRLAILAYDYPDFCRGRVEPTGVNELVKRLLHSQGYKVMVVPYTDFRSRDKLIHRVQYIESKLKSAVQM